MARTAAALAAIMWVLLTAGTASGQQIQTPRPPLHDADYFAFADKITEGLESSWKESKGYYVTGARSIDTIANAAMLTVFATAAASGHVGPARNDARARQLADRLTASPPFYTDPAPPAPDKMFHSPGWTSNIDGPYVDMDKSIDPKVAEGLQIAYRARDVLKLDPATAARIQDEIHRVAFTQFFRYPLVRLNQINWHAELYAYDYLVNRDPTLLRDDYRKHVEAFTQGFKHPQIQGGSTNVGPSYRFTYQSNAPGSLPRNLDSAEYANMTVHFLYWYDLGLQAGMAPLPGEDIRLLRAWVQRDLYGYWTHAGFMNWDTGWSYERWMKGKAWAYAQQGLLAIATSPTFQTRTRETLYAKYLFDRGLQLYEHLGYQKPGRPWRPSAQLFGIGRQGAPASKMFWSRMAANAARAVSAGMGDLPAAEPPPFYAYDADIGRLAVSTRHYSTAIVAVSRGKLPYGGIDLARLYDGDGDPIGGTGGQPPAAFGMTVTSSRGHRLLATQTGLTADPKRPPLILTHSPRGRVTRQRRLSTRPDAGAFKALSVLGRRSANGVQISSGYTFHNRSIDASWTVRRPKGKGRVQPKVLFPTWGRHVRIEAQLRSGRAVALTSRNPVDLSAVRWLRMVGDRGVYRVGFRRPVAGTTQIYGARRQKASPLSGPTLAMVLAPLKHGRRDLEVTITPTGSGGTVPEPATPFSAP